MPSMRVGERLDVDLGLADCSSPIPPMRRLKLIAPPVAIIVLLGMQSHRWAAPPITSRSITVTLAPSRAAYGGCLVAGRTTADDDEANAHARQATPASAALGRRARRGVAGVDRRSAITSRRRAASRPVAEHVVTPGRAVDCGLVRRRGSGSTSTGTATGSRRSPTHSKCMPSGWRKLPPHANP